MDFHELTAWQRGLSPRLPDIRPSRGAGPTGHDDDPTVTRAQLARQFYDGSGAVVEVLDLPRFVEVFRHGETSWNEAYPGGRYAICQYNIMDHVCGSPNLQVRSHSIILGRVADGTPIGVYSAADSLPAT